MLEYNQIHKGEYGLTVRAKLNNMLRALIVGDEGVNSIWKSLVELNNKFGVLDKKVDSSVNEFNKSIIDCKNYTDEQVTNIFQYVNAMAGGVSGFAENTDYMPDFPTEKPATVIAASAGEYKNMLDVNGNPITIEKEGVITIFYKGANTDRWQYKSLDITPKISCKCKELYNVHYRYGVEMPTTLEVAIASVPESDRIPGQMLSFLEKKDWRLWQFRGEKVEDYLDLDYWVDMGAGTSTSYIKLNPSTLIFEDMSPKTVEITTNPYNMAYSISVQPQN